MRERERERERERLINRYCYLDFLQLKLSSFMYYVINLNTESTLMCEMLLDIISLHSVSVYGVKEFNNLIYLLSFL